MQQLYFFFDSFIMVFYRLTGFVFIDFLIGTFCLAMIAVVVGEFTISILFSLNKKHIEAIGNEVDRYQTLSINALQAGNKVAYKAANKMANEAFGKSFFLQIALSAGFIWPAIFALWWMSQRFADVEFELLFFNTSVSYVCPFIALFAAAKLIFNKIKHRIPYFGRMQQILDSYKKSTSMDPCIDKQPERIG